MCLDEGGTMDASTWPQTHHPLGVGCGDGNTAEDKGPAAAILMAPRPTPGASDPSPGGSASDPGGAGVPVTVQTPAWSGGSGNPFAVGHLVNHSGGRRPNVCSVSFLWRNTPLFAMPELINQQAKRLADDLAASHEYGGGVKYLEREAVSGKAGGPSPPDRACGPPAAASPRSALPEAERGLHCERHEVPNQIVSGFWYVLPADALGPPITADLLAPLSLQTLSGLIVNPLGCICVPLTVDPFGFQVRLPNRRQPGDAPGTPG